jgi:hypothetical protein
MKSEEELAEAIKSLSNALADLNRDLRATQEAQAKVDAGEFRDLTSAFLQKKMEEGIINNFHRATPEQIERIMKRPEQYFRYYKVPKEEPEFIDVK